ncbi:MAG TPA: MFS transporter [Anaeromyxobacter sp.]
MADPTAPARRGPGALPGGDLPSTFWWLFAGMLVNALASFVFPFLALFLTSRGFSAARAGLVVAAYGGGSVLAGPVAGALADRIGRRPTLLGSLLAGSGLTAMLAFVEGPAAIAAAALALGLVTHAFRPAAHAIVADVVPPGRRGHALGLLYWANNLGMAIALVLGGAIASRGYGALFLADAATTLAFAVLAWWRVPETRPALAGAVSSSAGPGERGAAGYREVLSDRAFLAFTLLNVVFLLPFLQFQVALPVDMARHGLSPADFGRVLAVNGFLIALVQPWAAPLARRFDPSHVLAAACGLVGLGYGAYAFASAAPGYAGATAVWSLGEIICVPVAGALVADFSPPHLRGRYQGAFTVSWGAAMLLAPALGGALLERFGAPVLWASCLAVELLVGTAHLALAPSRRRALAATSAPAESG